MLKKIHKLLTAVAVLVTYIEASLFFLRGVLFSPGIMMGGDWGFPQTISQMNRFFTSGLYTWTDREIFGSEQYFLNALPFQAFIGLLAKSGITGDTYTKVFLVVAFVFPACSMYLFCRFIGCKRLVSFLGGFLYMTLPVFFNYAAMGWLYVLFSMGILPLALITFIKSVKENKAFYSILTGILYSLAMMQSQSFVWYPIAFLALIPFLVKDKKTFLTYIKSFCIIVITFLGLNAYWYLPLFLSGGGKILNTNLGASTISLGTWARLNPLNIIRVWGSLFNEPYEGSALNAFVPLSFVLPVTAFSSLWIFKKNRLVNSLLLLSFIPITLFILGPQFIVRLPFSDLIRDIARFLVLSSFAYVVLSTLVLNFLFESKQRAIRITGVALSLLLILSSYLFWNGELYGQSKLGYDIKLRSYDFPKEYLELEDILSRDLTDVKVLYLPIAGELSITDDKRFYGTYQGIRDITASYSSKPGMVGLSDRVRGLTANFTSQLNDQIDRQQTKNVSNLLALMNVKYVVVRRNMTHPAYRNYWTGKEIADRFMSDDELRPYQQWATLALFENNAVLPHIYTPSAIVVSKRDSSALPQIVSAWGYNPQSAVYFTAQNPQFQPFEFQIPAVSFKKMNPTKYYVTIHNASIPFPLVFSELYHQQWKLYPHAQRQSAQKFNETWSLQSLSENNHLIANGYANSWIVDPQKICNQHNLCYQNADGSYDMEFIIEFLPQRFFYIGAIISVLSLIVGLAYIIVSSVVSTVHEKQA